MHRSSTFPRVAWSVLSAGATPAANSARWPRAVFGRSRPAPPPTRPIAPPRPPMPPAPLQVPTAGFGSNSVGANMPCCTSSSVPPGSSAPTSAPPGIPAASPHHPALARRERRRRIQARGWHQDLGFARLLAPQCRRPFRRIIPTALKVDFSDGHESPVFSVR